MYKHLLKLAYMILSILSIYIEPPIEISASEKIDYEFSSSEHIEYILNTYYPILT